MTEAILVTGGSGQVGTALRAIAGDRFELVMPPRAELDLSDPASIEACLTSRDWAAVVSSGAYTAVDKAESDVVAAWRANAIGPAALGAGTRARSIPIVHLSTDYVFDGSKPGFYAEGDPVAPLGVYGASKEGGEQAIRSANPAHVILRTAWVVSPFGANFIKTMLRVGAQRPELSVVADQVGCPTSALDIAKTVAAILDRQLTDPAAPKGTYHFVNAGEASWHGLAEAVFARAAVRGGPSPAVKAITTAEYPTPARRPVNSRLATDKLVRDYGITPRPWREAINEIVDTLVSGEVTA
ncbi:dTDP-4-dehydrorhamnose reductase [Sphingomonas sp. BIUV-7]|uniref:dTDP-4-dehydrorhamnose reductase n=1 Tax=Sphingomonas natans TaxID=3063330 RepID=A0ABT8Y7G3_9SPHN|nr:dTDP-4-dehydrorhamnose reductase [Sphingomonas sp. BIUV-7]MDO6413640.1 dTDP-4-dehydrorhamnose reductase [Sphingomonas sp. BIUV-7]